MILHWFTTAWRSLIRNPLFSAITIVSLSIGCCGALLAGSNILQHMSFERFHKDADRILIVTRTTEDQGPIMVGPSGQRIQSTSRTEGPGGSRPQTTVAFPMKAAISGKVQGIEAQTRLLYSTALFKSDQDELDRRSNEGPPAPGDPTRAPLPGSVYVDEDFFKVFPMEFIEGSAEGLQEPDAVIITQNRAERLFGKAPAVGKTAEGVKGHTLRIIGVVKTLPANTHMVFQTAAGLRTMQMVGQNIGPAYQTNWNRWWSGFHYIKVSEGANLETFIPMAANSLNLAAGEGAKQTAPASSTDSMFVAMEQPKMSYSLVPLLESHLAGPEKINFHFAASSSGDPALVWTLAAGAAALMVVSSFNYVTLSLARSLRRRREVAVRKVLGAGRGQLVQQYLVESGIVTAISLAIGFVAAWFLHPWFARTINQPETMFNLTDPGFIGIALASFAVLALTVGAYPAFYLAAVRPRTGLGEGGTASPGRIGQAVSAGLLGIQIASAACLLIISATMVTQANFIATRGMGFSVKDRYQAQLFCQFSERPSDQEMQRIMRVCSTGARDVISKTPGIQKAYFYNGTLLSETINTEAIGRTAAGEEIGRTARMSVDLEFLQNMGTTLLAGRYFDANSAYDRANIEFQKIAMSRPPPMPGQPPPDPSTTPKPPARIPVIVTRALLSALGAQTPDEAIGMNFAFKPNQRNPYEIIGVIEDWHQRPLTYEVTPVVFVPQLGQAAVLDIERGRVAEVQKALQDEWRKMLGNPKIGVTVSDLEETMNNAYKSQFRLMWALVSFAGVAIVVAGLGVYGLSAFEMRRRVREIGIRKALGATPGKVAGMVIGRALMFAGIATLLAWPLGWWIAQQWLMGFVYRTELGLVVLPLATAAVLAFVAVAVALNAIRASAIRPSIALRPD